MEAMRSKYGDEIEIDDFPLESNAQCILIYSNGNIFATPYFEGVDNKKYIGNLLAENPKDIFEKFKSDDVLWNDYLGLH